jgi:hypothetical protein
MATAEVLDEYLVATVDMGVLEGWATDEFGLASSAPPNTQPYPALLVYDHANSVFYHRHGWCVRVCALTVVVCLFHSRHTPPQVARDGAAVGRRDGATSTGGLRGVRLVRRQAGADGNKGAGICVHGRGGWRWRRLQSADSPTEAMRALLDDVRAGVLPSQRVRSATWQSVLRKQADTYLRMHPEMKVCSRAVLSPASPCPWVRAIIVLAGGVGRLGGRKRV